MVTIVGPAKGHVCSGYDCFKWSPIVLRQKLNVCCEAVNKDAFLVAVLASRHAAPPGPSAAQNRPGRSVYFRWNSDVAAGALNRKCTWVTRSPGSNLSVSLRCILRVIILLAETIWTEQNLNTRPSTCRGYRVFTYPLSLPTSFSTKRDDQRQLHVCSFAWLLYNHFDRRSCG